MSLADDIARVAACARGGGLIAYPTEAVYGLGCDPRSVSAVQRIIDLKGRDAAKGLILVAADLQQLLDFIETPDADSLARIGDTWPGPNTWILPARSGVSALLSGGTGRLAVRVSAFGTVRELCRRAGTALVSTSANPAGQPPARDAASVRRYFATGIDDLLDAPTGGAQQPSRLFDGADGRRLR